MDVLPNLIIRKGNDSGLAIRYKSDSNYTIRNGGDSGLSIRYRYVIVKLINILSVPTSAALRHCNPDNISRLISPCLLLTG